MGMVAPTYYSADMVRAFPDDGNRFETVHGELLVTPAPHPPHQLVVTELTTRLGNYLKAHPIGRVLVSPADISWARDILVQPDVFVVPREEGRASDWTRVRMLVLAVEVLSPSSRRADRFTKRRVYQEHGVPAYRVVDIEGRAVEAWTPEATVPTVERERVVWHPGGAAGPWMIELARSCLRPDPPQPDLSAGGTPRRASPAAASRRGREITAGRPAPATPP